MIKIKNNIVKYDKPLLAALVGAVSVVPYEIIVIIAKYFGLVSLTVFQMNSMLIYKQGSWLIGAVTTPLIGGIVSFVLYRMLQIIGTDYLPIKGVFAALITWAILETFFELVFRGITTEKTVLGHFIHAFGAGTAGFTIGYLLKKFVIKPV